MSVDQSRQHNHSTPIDNRCTWSRDRLANRHNLPVPNVNIAPGNIAEFTVHSHDVSVPQHQLAARGQPAWRTLAPDALRTSHGKCRHAPHKSTPVHSSSSRHIGIVLRESRKG